MKKDQYLEISIRYGALIFGMLVAYFFIMKFVGLIDHQELRAVNGVIIFGGVLLAISNIKKVNGDNMNYFSGIGYGILTTLFGVAPFAFFVMFYLLIDDGFLRTIQEKSAFGELVNPFTGALINLLEGIAAGTISSYMIMQYFKTSILKQMHNKKIHRHGEIIGHRA